MKNQHALALATLLTLAAQPALAVTTAGGVDPQIGMATFLGWALVMGGITIPLICVWKGVHAVAEGRHLGPYIGQALGGTALAFGGGWLLNHYGVI